MNRESQGSPKRLKSGESRVMSFVRFINKTSRRVDVVWINFEGHGVKYKTIDSGEFLDVNTYVGHPWVFRDSLTGEKMVVQMNYVYHPSAPPEGQSSRRIVTVTIPLYSLKERSMQVVRSLFTRNAIKSLELPMSLIEDLLKTHQYERNIERLL